MSVLLFKNKYKDQWQMDEIDRKLKSPSFFRLRLSWSKVFKNFLDWWSEVRRSMLIPLKHWIVLLMIMVMTFMGYMILIRLPKSSICFSVQFVFIYVYTIPHLTHYSSFYRSKDPSRWLERCYRISSQLFK